MIEEHILSLPFKLFFANAAAGAVLTDLSGKILVANPAFMLLVGQRAEEVNGRNILKYIPAEKNRDVHDMLDGLATDTHRRYKSETSLSQSRNQTLLVLLEATPVQDATGRPLCMMFTVSEISAEQRGKDMPTRASATARYTDEICLEILDGIPQTLLSINHARHIEGINKHGESAFGYAKQELMNRPIEVLFPELTWQAPLPDTVHHAVRPLFAVHALHKNGERIPVLLDLKTIQTGDRPFWVGIVQNLSGRKTTGDISAYPAWRDPVTGLCTPILFQERLQHAVSKAERDGKKLGVLMLDLDRFKEINDSLGHEGGDELLKNAGARIAALLRKSDTVSRFEDNHYAILLEGLNKAEHAFAVAQKLISAFAAPFLCEKQDVYLTPSIGIGIFPIDGVDSESLVKNARSALHLVKKGGGNAFQFYTQTLNTRVIERIRLDSDLRRALKHGQFVIYYQPLVNTVDGQVICVEALLRWNHPGKGLIPPLSFIPLLEETGLIVQVGDFVLRAACRQIKMLRNNGHNHLRVAVNISARQFSQKDFAANVGKIIREIGLDPHALELEITESVLLENTEEVGKMLASLAELGIRIALDDFGTGCSSLSYLKHFPIHTLKIDRNFVHGLPHDRDDVAIANAIITLGTELGLKVIAEGVETDEQLAYLRERQCHEVQGFLFARPMPAEELNHWLHQRLH
jgi:diguanylate cyclase (GGDEF)-like protein/PAS domain S-box-containing protein